MRAMVGAVVGDYAALPDKRLAEPAPSGAYSIRLADIDTRLDHIQQCASRTDQAQREISERLRHIEEKTAESSRILTELWVSIRQSPLLSKYLTQGRGR